MDTDNRNETIESQETNTNPEERTFTQADVDRIIQKRLAKYADYEDMKAKADKFDEIDNANKSELQKLTEEKNKLQAELDKRNEADKVRTIRAEVAKETGIPAELLTGSDRETCEMQAQSIKEYAKPDYPSVKDGGEPQGTGKKANRELFSDWLQQQY